MQRTMSFLAGALCGAVVGAVAALLLAPMSGQELQSQARSQFEHVLAEARAAAAERRAMLKGRLGDLRAPKKNSIELQASTEE